MKISIKSKNSEIESELKVQEEKTYVNTSSEKVNLRKDSLAIDIEEIKRQMRDEILSSIRAEEEEKASKRKREYEEREKALERAEAEIKEEKETFNKNKSKFNRRSKMIEKNNVESNEDYRQNYLIKLRNQKFKKTIFSFSFYSIICLTLVTNIYYVFFKKEQTIETSAQQVKSIIQFTKFPKEGVETYIKDNIKDILEEDVQITGSSGTKNWDVQDVFIRKIADINDSFANVFFSLKVSTNNSSIRHNYILALKYDNITKSYSPASKLISRVVLDEDEIKMSEDDNIIWGFKDKKEYEKGKEDELTLFLEQFFTVLYNNKTYPNSAYLKTESELSFDNKEYSFSFINYVKWYQESNFMGCNCEVNYSITSSEGLTYTVTSYLAVYEDGYGSYKILSVY